MPSRLFMMVPKPLKPNSSVDQRLTASMAEVNRPGRSCRVRKDCAAKALLKGGRPAGGKGRL